MAELPPLPHGIRSILDQVSSDWLEQMRRAAGDIDIVYLDSAQNLADLVDAVAARQNLGVEIGVDVQAYDAGLQSISGLTTSADTMIYTTALDTYATATITAAGRALLDDASANNQRTTLGLGSIATQDANNVSITGGTITGITDLAVADGGTGASTAADARTNLGLVIGTNVQAQDAELQAIAGLTSAADGLPYFTGSGTAALATFTTAGRALVDDASASDQRTTLGLGTISTQAASSVSITGGTITGITDLAVADGGTGASTAADARTNLGLAIGTNVQAWSAVLDATTASFTTADETKLDNIEALADVTDATNVTAAGALMDSELADIASVKALNQGVATTDTPTFVAVNLGNTNLSDYVEGTFTPEVADAASAGNTATGTFYGHYQRVGNRVTLDISLTNIDTTGMTAGNTLFIRNLPYSAANLTGAVYFTGSVLAASVNTASKTLVAGMIDNSDYIRIFDIGTGAMTGLVIVSDLTSGTSDIYFTINYQV